MSRFGYAVETAPDTKTLFARCDLVVTTTPSTEPLVFGKDLRPGTHITALGADTRGKQELEAEVFAKADIVIADSKDQCADHGDLFSALTAGTISLDRVGELGEVVLGNIARTSNEQITIADLTGLAVQDLCIAEAVLAAAMKESV